MSVSVRAPAQTTSRNLDRAPLRLDEILRVRVPPPIGMEASPAKQADAEQRADAGQSEATIVIAEPFVHGPFRFAGCELPFYGYIRRDVYTNGRLYVNVMQGGPEKESRKSVWTIVSISASRSDFFATATKLEMGGFTSVHKVDPSCGRTMEKAIWVIVQTVQEFRPNVTSIPCRDIATLGPYEESERKDMEKRFAKIAVRIKANAEPMEGIVADVRAEVEKWYYRIKYYMSLGFEFKDARFKNLGTVIDAAVHHVVYVMKNHSEPKKLDWSDFASAAFNEFEDVNDLEGITHDPNAILEGGPLDTHFSGDLVTMAASRISDRDSRILRRSSARESRTDRARHRRVPSLDVRVPPPIGMEASPEKTKELVLSNKNLIETILTSLPDWEVMSACKNVVNLCRTFKLEPCSTPQFWHYLTRELFAFDPWLFGAAIPIPELRMLSAVEGALASYHLAEIDSFYHRNATPRGTLEHEQNSFKRACQLTKKKLKEAKKATSWYPEGRMMVHFDTKPYVMAALESGAMHLREVSRRLRGDKEVVLHAITYDTESDNDRPAPPSRRGRPNEGGASMRWASELLRKDKHFVLEALSLVDTLFPLRYAHSDLRKNEEFLDEVIKTFVLDNNEVYTEANVLTDDWELAFANLVSPPHVSEHEPSESLLGDEDFVRQVIEMQQENFWHSESPHMFLIHFNFADKLMDNEKLIGAIDEATSHLPPTWNMKMSLWSDETRREEARKMFYETKIKRFETASSTTLNELVKTYFDVKPYIMAMLRSDQKLGLNLVSRRLRGDKEVVLQAIRREVRHSTIFKGASMLWASEPLRKDKYFVLEAITVANNLIPLRYAHSDVRKDPDVLHHLINTLNFDENSVYNEVKSFTDDKNRINRAFITKMIENDPYTLKYIPVVDEFLGDTSLIQALDKKLASMDITPEDAYTLKVSLQSDESRWEYMRQKKN